MDCTNAHLVDFVLLKETWFQRKTVVKEMKKVKNSQNDIMITFST